MEFTGLSETERANDVYVVSAETSMDLIKVEPVDEYDEDVVVEDDDTNSEQTESVLDTNMYTYTRFNETLVSDATNFVSDDPSREANRTETGFKLKFVHESGIKAI